MTAELDIDRAAVFCDGLDHAECVATHPEGSVWAGGEAGQIYRISPDGCDIDEVASTEGFTLGIAFSPGADWLVACDLKGPCLWRLDVATGRLQQLADRAGDHRFAIPNHACFAADGTLYVSESGGFDKATGKVLRFDANDPAAGEVWHAGPFHFANGTALSPDERWLYVVCSWLPGVERIEVCDDGSAGRREVYVTLPDTVPDGIAFDEQGDLLVGCYTPARLYRVTPDRTVRCLIDDPTAHTLCNPTNIAFGGADHRALFSANLGRWHLTRITMDVAGHLLPSHRTEHVL